MNITQADAPDQKDGGVRLDCEKRGNEVVSINQVSEGLASLLPHTIDKLTPGGNIPEGNALEQSIRSLVGKFLKG